MVKANFRGLLGVSFVLVASACSSQPAASQGGLTADPTARSFGIASYVVEGDNVRMLDAYGMELGSLSVRDAADSRIIDVAMTNGQTDEIEVYRPASDGRFYAPINRDAATSVALGDAALAPLFAAHGVKFTASVTVQNDAALEPSIVATTSSCVGTDPNHNNASCVSNCDWQSDSPAGCARPANLSVGCSNPSQLPATLNSGSGVYCSNSYQQNTTQTNAIQLTASDCASACSSLGYSSNQPDWVPIVTCTGAGSSWSCSCNGTPSGNSWVSSCPRSTCGTVGDYDAVPRLRNCLNPGSCTKSQGTVGCTPYH